MRIERAVVRISLSDAEFRLIPLVEMVPKNGPDLNGSDILDMALGPLAKIPEGDANRESSGATSVSKGLAPADASVLADGIKAVSVASYLVGDFSYGAGDGVTALWLIAQESPQVGNRKYPNLSMS
jgi:hypothetical protein